MSLLRKIYLYIITPTTSASRAVSNAAENGWVRSRSTPSHANATNSRSTQSTTKVHASFAMDYTHYKVHLDLYSEVLLIFCVFYFRENVAFLTPYSSHRPSTYRRAKTWMCVQRSSICTGWRRNMWLRLPLKSSMRHSGTVKLCRCVREKRTKRVLIVNYGPHVLFLLCRLCSCPSRGEALVKSW